MSLVSYIPLREANVRHGGKDIPVIGIKGFTIEIDRLTATYEVWLDVNSSSSIIAASDNVITNAISLTPTSMNESAVFIIDGLLVNCTIKYYTYHSNKHAYLVKIEFLLNKDQVQSYIYDADNGESGKQTRFDILDL